MNKTEPDHPSSSLPQPEANPPGRSSGIKSLWTKLGVYVGILCLLGWWWYDYRFPTWREEVLLGDGRLVVVKQARDDIKDRGTRRTWLTLTLPELGGEQTWSEYLYPSLLGVVDGKVYVVGRPRGSTQFSLYRYPRYVYVAFVWNGKQFERIPFLSVPESIRKEENLRWCLPSQGDRYVAWDLKAKLWCEEPGGQFPMPRSVDLRVRAAEASYWAGLDGHRPSTE